MSDDLARRLAEQPVPWDDARQQRVLERVERALEHPEARERGRGPWGWPLAAGGLLAAAAMVVLWVLWPRAPLPVELPGEAAADRVAVAPLPSIPYATWPQLRLPDHSRAELRYGARVDVDVQRDDLVRLRQHSGEVRYEVAPDRARAFVVDAAGVEVRVVGTIFTVTLADDAQRVEVEVERGLVEVDDGTRVAELGPGDALRLEVGSDDDEVVLIEPEPEPEPAGRPRAPATSPGPSVDALLADADAARARGDLPRAAAALGELVRRYPRDPRAYGATFQLGKVERARGRHAAAAAAFSKCWKRSPRGALAEDARAEAAVAWEAAGRSDRARATAEGYLGKYPEGAHAPRMRRLLGGP